MDIPPRPRESGDNHYSKSTPTSFVEGLASSYKRTWKFEAVDTRARRQSSTQAVRPVPEASHEDVVPENVDDADEERMLPHAKNVASGKNTMQKRRFSTTASGSDENSLLLPPGSFDAALIARRSTTIQTVFNITNLLIGIGLLSLPLGIRLAGWALGLSLLVIGALTTAYTAILLSRSLETKPEAYAYSDIGTMAYGRIMTYITGLIFMFELMAAGSALIILFSDNFHAVVPVISSGTFKVICLAIMLPATLLPLSILSYASVIGILSTVVLLVVVFVDGLWKMEAPGSLHDPLPTEVFPSRWTTVPLSIGLLMASFGGHGIFPQVYTDMQDRKQFAKSIWIAYAFSTAVCIFMGVIGYLMFGEHIEAEITINLLKTAGYPKVLNRIATALTAITSLTKTPLTTKSISANIDIFLGLRTMAEERRAGFKRFAQYLSVRVFVNVTIFLLAFFFPDFDRVMGVLGSAFVFLISVILPTLFYIRIMDRTKTKVLGTGRLTLLWSLVAVSVGLAVIGTVWAILPFEI